MAIIWCPDLHINPSHIVNQTQRIHGNDHVTMYVLSVEQRVCGA